jgi:F-type H+-transporting ATPase subunit epsilon
MASLPFELVSPERLLVSEQVDSVTAPGIEGEFTVMAGHAPFITILKPGIVTVTTGSAARRLYVRGGFAEVNPTGLTILADIAIPVEELSGARFTAEVAAAQLLVTNAQDDDVRRRAEERLAWINDLGAAVTPQSATAH